MPGLQLAGWEHGQGPPDFGDTQTPNQWPPTHINQVHIPRKERTVGSFASLVNSDCFQFIGTFYLDSNVICRTPMSHDR